MVYSLYNSIAEVSMKIKYRVFTIYEETGSNDIENRINEELRGWSINKIISLEVERFDNIDAVQITLVGQVCPGKGSKLCCCE